MSAYLIIKAQITDREKFQAYADAVPSVVQQFGGEYVAMDLAPDVFEGAKDFGSVVMSKWPSKAAAQAFWHSDEYKKILPLRANTGHFNVTLVNGL